MMSGFAMRQAEATFRRALAAYGAVCVPVWRVQRDANGVPIGGTQKIGCVYGVRYERGQTANVLVDIPGVIDARAEVVLRPRRYGAELAGGRRAEHHGQMVHGAARRRADGHPLRRGAERGRAGWD